MKHIEELKIGIYIEELDEYIPWGKRFDELKNVGKPRIIRSHREIALLWQRVTIWNGLTTTLRARFIQASMDLDTLDQLSLSWPAKEDEDSRDKYKRVKILLENRFGSADEEREGETSSVYSRWRFGELEMCLMLGSRFGSQLYGIIKVDTCIL